MALLKELTNRGASEDFIKIVSVVVAPPALEALSRQFSGTIVSCNFHARFFWEYFVKNWTPTYDVLKYCLVIRDERHKVGFSTLVWNLVQYTCFHLPFCHNPILLSCYPFVLLSGNGPLKQPRLYFWQLWWSENSHNKESLISFETSSRSQQKFIF